jgi:hypothetical protein
MMRTLIEMVRTNLLSSGLPKELWDEALFYSVHTVNLLPFKGMGETPYSKWSRKRPHYEKLHRFGALAIKHVPKEVRKKLDSKGIECIFTGYDKTGFRLFMPETNRISYSRHVKVLDDILGASYFDDKTLFEEQLRVTHDASQKETAEEVISQEDINWDVPVSLDHFFAVPEDAYVTPSSNEASGSSHEPASSDESVSSPSTVVPVDGPRAPLVSRLPVLSRPSNLRQLPRQNYAMMSALSLKVPESYDEAMSSPFREQWTGAMNEEMDSLKQKGTWELVDRPDDNTNIIKNKWVYSLKTDEAGNVIKFKARLTAKGYSQIEGVDFDETYAPVSDYTCVRIFLLLVLLWNLHCHQLDIESAFLNSLLEFLCFMEQATGFDDGSGRVYRLWKSLYGLNDWHLTIKQYLVSIGFKPFRSDPCLFSYSEGNVFVFLLLWVDDMLIASSDATLLGSLKKKILKEFAGRDFGNIDSATFLKWTIKKTSSELFISQKNLIKLILQKFNMLDSKPVPNPGNSSVILGLEDSDNADYPYRSVIGSLFHLVNCTRPDLSFSVGYCSRFQSSYGPTEVTAAKRILQYLNASKELGLYYKRPEDFKGLEMVVFVDASHAPQGEKSTTGYVVFINGNPVSWKSQKQSVTSKSAAESEYVALSAAVSEAIFLVNLISEFGFQVATPIPVLEDNTAAIKISSQPTKKSKVKHVNLHHHFVRDYVDLGIIEVRHVSTEAQVADLFTKNLNGHKFQDLAQKLNLKAFG